MRNLTCNWQSQAGKSETVMGSQMMMMMMRRKAVGCLARKLIKLQWRRDYQRIQREEKLRITKCHSLVLGNVFRSCFNSQLHANSR